MIVVIGSPVGWLADGMIGAAGTPSLVALAAAGAGSTVQLVGRVGDDPTADAVVLDLVRGGVGHVALLRDGSRPTPLESPPAEDAEPDDADDDSEPIDEDVAVTSEGPTLDAADVDLGLRYLTEFAVIVVAEPVDAATVAVLADAASWADARLILVLPSGAGMPGSLPADAVVFEAPDADPDGAFARLVGQFAAGLGDGVEPEAAFRASLGSDGWTGADEA